MAVKELGPEDLLEIADKDGVAVSSVSDGFILVFTKRQLEMTLKAITDKGQEKCVIFVKNRKFDN